MAIGGALRSAIKLGRFSVAARESRRQARILQSAFPDGARGLDPQRGRMLPLEERGFERMMGQGYGGTARGNAIVVDPASGRRIVVNQNFDDFMEGLPAGGRGPIEAPYEGFRVFRVDGVQDSVPPWMGRGRAPLTDQPYIDDIISMPDAYAPYNPRNPEVFGDLSYLRVPSAFGGAAPYPMPSLRPAYRNPPRYSFDDIAEVFTDRGPGIQF